MKSIQIKTFLFAGIIASAMSSCSDKPNNQDPANATSDSTTVSSSLPDDQNQLASNAFTFVQSQSAFSHFNRLAALSPNVKRILELKNPIIVLVPSDALINTSDEATIARFAGKEEAQTAEEMLLPYIFMIIEQKGKVYNLENFSKTNKFTLDLNQMTLDEHKLNGKFVKVENGIVLESPIMIGDN
jgi:hypothetical protein